MRLSSVKTGCLLLISGLLLGGFLYVALVSLSEHREYKKSSLDYWLLTSEEMVDISAFCTTDPVFTYSAADGSKPSMLKIDCKLSEAIIEYFASNKYSKSAEDYYKKDNQEFEITRTPEQIISVVQLDHL